jgi:hypothetical protein
VVLAYVIGDTSLEYPVAYGLTLIRVDEHGRIFTNEDGHVQEVDVHVYLSAKLP